jgi:hypothetical protein
MNAYILTITFEITYISSIKIPFLGISNHYVAQFAILNQNECHTSHQDMSTILLLNVIPKLNTVHRKCEKYTI